MDEDQKRLSEHLDRAFAIVATWPLWKQHVLSRQFVLEMCKANGNPQFDRNHLYVPDWWVMADQTRTLATEDQ